MIAIENWNVEDCKFDFKFHFGVLCIGSTSNAVGAFTNGVLTNSYYHDKDRNFIALNFKSKDMKSEPYVDAQFQKNFNNVRNAKNEFGIVYKIMLPRMQNKILVLISILKTPPLERLRTYWEKLGPVKMIAKGLNPYSVGLKSRISGNDYSNGLGFNIDLPKIINYLKSFYPEISTNMFEFELKNADYYQESRKKSGANELFDSLKEFADFYSKMLPQFRQQMINTIDEFWAKLQKIENEVLRNSLENVFDSDENRKKLEILRLVLLYQKNDRLKLYPDYFSMAICEDNCYSYVCILHHDQKCSKLENHQHLEQLLQNPCPSCHCMSDEHCIVKGNISRKKDFQKNEYDPELASKIKQEIIQAEIGLNHKQRKYKSFFDGTNINISSVSLYSTFEDFSDIDYVIVLIGEAGDSKTSLIAAYMNMFSHSDFLNLFDLEDIPYIGQRPGSQDFKYYCCIGSEGKKYLFIDTPDINQDKPFNYQDISKITQELKRIPIISTILVTQKAVKPNSFYITFSQEIRKISNTVASSIFIAYTNFSGGTLEFDKELWGFPYADDIKININTFGNRNKNQKLKYLNDNWNFVVGKLGKLLLKIVTNVDDKNRIEKFRKINLEAAHDFIDKNLDITIKMPRKHEFSQPQLISKDTFQVYNNYTGNYSYHSYPRQINSEEMFYEDTVVFPLTFENESKLEDLMNECFGPDAFSRFSRVVKGKFSLDLFRN